MKGRLGQLLRMRQFTSAIRPIYQPIHLCLPGLGDVETSIFFGLLKELVPIVAASNPCCARNDVPPLGQDRRHLYKSVSRSSVVLFEHKQLIVLAGNVFR